MFKSVVGASVAVFLVGFGEELWKKFLPKYLEALGAGTRAIGLWGTAEDFFDAIYQYPGGLIADTLGRRRALLSFLATASVGYTLYLVSPSWPYVFLGLLFVSVWRSMGSPAIFAVIGDSLPEERRALGFTIQSMLKRVPMIVSPVVGGALLARAGVVEGTRIGFLLTLAMVLLSLPFLRAVTPTAGRRDGRNLFDVWRRFHVVLKRLLVSDILIRMAESLGGVFVILYLMNVRGIGLSEYAWLVALQMATSFLVYVPAARFADFTGRKPFVTATFACFALFPVAVALATSTTTLVLAFIVGGLREIGEPARKAMIVDLAPHDLRGRTVGLYYLLRSASITPAALIGSFLWEVSPRAPFLAAGIVGFTGLILFTLTVEESSPQG